MLKKSNIIKFDSSENNNNIFLSILQKNKDVFAIIKFATLIAQLNSTTIANIRIIDLNKKIFEKLYSILDFMLF